MKIRVPQYYKNFKCIAGACTDTCCAGWEVDVEKKSYDYYKKVKGRFGEKLKSVMIPDEEGGCTFRLNNGRCPFLNDKNLCDLFIELGEDRLCDTCAEFPRFINEFGMEREIGIAPSCKTAGELIFSHKEPLTFDMIDTDEQIENYNDIDAQLYFKLRKARVTAYNIIRNRKFTINERCLLYLEFVQKLQHKIDKYNKCKKDAMEFADEFYDEEDECLDEFYDEEDECSDEFYDEEDEFAEDLYDEEDECLDEFYDENGNEIEHDAKDYEINEYEINAYNDDNYLEKRLVYIRKKYCRRGNEAETIRSYFDTFKGMEVINKDWYKCLDINKNFFSKYEKKEEFEKIVDRFDDYYKDKQYEYEQLLMYYVFRYFMEAVYDGNLLLKAKTAVIGYIILKQLDINIWENNNEQLTFTEQVDLAHLYSRQFEHSYFNFEYYMEMFQKKRRYSYKKIMELIV